MIFISGFIAFACGAISLLCVLVDRPTRIHLLSERVATLAMMGGIVAMLLSLIMFLGKHLP